MTDEDYEWMWEFIEDNAPPSKRKTLIAALMTCTDTTPFITATQKMAAYDTMCRELSQLNTMRGGVKGFKGFVGESMHAANATAAGRMTSVVNNNSPIDLIFKGNNGHLYPQQLKIGYKPGQINYPKYKGQTIIVDKGNPYLKQLQSEGRAHGVRVVEGTVTESEAKRWASEMQLESKITGNSRSYLVPQTQKFMKNVSAMHEAGLKAGKSGALYGAGFSIGSNIVKMMRDDIRFSDAAANVVCDTAISGAVGYGAGAIGSAIGGTIGRTAAGKAVAAAATKAGTAFAGTAVGGAVATGVGVIEGAAVAGTSSAVGMIGAAGSAIGSAAVSATAGTAIGGAVATGVGAAGAAGAALGAAAVAAAPVVAVGAVLGAFFSLFSDD